jgi:periplasmic protein TonB
VSASPAASDRRAERRRYGGSLALVVAAHLAPFAALVHFAPPSARGGGATPAAVLLELAPPAPKPEPALPKPVVEPPKARPKPVARRAVTPPAPAPAPSALPTDPIPLPDSTPPPPPSGAPPAGVVAARPGPARGAHGKITWKGLVLGHLERFKRYPARSRLRREEGVSWVHVTLDREGEVVAARLLRSCGHDALDRETLALVRRASPLPAPPPEKPGDRIQLEIPVEFSLRR